MEKEIADKILHDTERGYDLISEKFSQTRKHFWRGLEFLKDHTHKGNRVLDFGCGNGRLLELIGDAADIEYYGTDVSEKLIEIAEGKHSNNNIHFLKTDPIQSTLPFETGFFNTVYSIAVFHHLPSQKYRREVANELFRVTKKDGRVVVTVWNLWQRKYFKNIVKNWQDKILGKSELDWNDCMISFTNNQGLKFERYHHAFTKREIKNLFQCAGFGTEKCKIVGGRNIVYVGKKI